MESNERKNTVQPRKTGEKQLSLREQANARMRESAGRKPSAERTKSQVSSENPQRKKVAANTEERPVRTQNTQQSKPVQKTKSDVSSKPVPKTKVSENERPIQKTKVSANERPVQKTKVSDNDRTVQKSKAYSGEERRKSSGKTPEDVRRERQTETIKRERVAARDAIKTERSSSYQKTKKKSPVFWIGFAIYTVILLIFSGIFLIYTDRSLAKYENSQSEHYMDEYINTFADNVKNNSFDNEDFSFGDLDMNFADTSAIIDSYLASLSNVTEFSYEKDPTSYLTEAPLYTILGDGTPIAKVSLKGVDPTKIFAILTIMDWDIDYLTPICEIDVSEIVFNIPEGYTPMIANKVVDSSYQTKEAEINPEYINVAEYVNMPSSVEYRVPNVLSSSDIDVIDSNGNSVSFIMSGNVVEVPFTSANGFLTDERKEEALKMVQTYEDIMTDDLGGSDHGFSKVSSFLIKDSYYYNYVKQWTTGVDITFTSAHRFDDPKYSNVVVDNYVEYTDNCYSLHIAFTKNMVFTKRDGKFSNDFDSTVFFVNYDDSDDGVDNPHWCIVDIIATTNN